MNAAQVLEQWRNTPEAAEWGPGARVKFCLDRRALYSVYDEEGELLGLLDASGATPRAIELFDEITQNLLLAGLWRDLS